MNIEFIVAPVVGGSIGFITNALAIKMLFRPYEAIYIGKFHVPFTPGIIPSQKERIAASIGRVISEHLLDHETIRNVLLSEQTIGAIRETAFRKVHGLQDCQSTLGEVLDGIIDQEREQQAARELSQQASCFIRDTLLEDEIGMKIAVAVTKDFSFIPSNLSIFSGMFNDVMGSVQGYIAENIDNLIRDKGGELIENELNAVHDTVLDLQVCDVYDAGAERIQGFVDAIEQVYRGVVVENADEFLDIINIEKVINDKIALFDARQLEELIFAMIKKELNAIIYLGAVLGALIGYVNILF